MSASVSSSVGDGGLSMRACCCFLNSDDDEEEEDDDDEDEIMSGDDAADDEDESSPPTNEEVSSAPFRPRDRCLGAIISKLKTWFHFWLSANIPSVEVPDFWLLLSCSLGNERGGQEQ
jgi:hypothetical protein